LARQVTGGTIIKALRLKSMQQLAQLEDYWPHIDALLLDAYHPTALGGTGQALPWLALQHFQPPKPWILAGGITPENIRECLALLSPDAIDVSSGVEFAPGDKDPQRVAQLLAALGEGSKAI
jgi:phosphoribosylanthranilate isomerase